MRSYLSFYLEIGPKWQSHVLPPPFPMKYETLEWGVTMYINQNFLLYKTGYLVNPLNPSIMYILSHVSIPQISAFLAVFCA